MRVVMFGLLRVAVGVAMTLVVCLLLLLLLVQVGTRLGLTPPGALELLLTLALAAVVARVAVRRIRPLWPTPPSEDATAQG